MVQGLIRDRLGQDRDSQLSKDGERQSAKQRQRLNSTVDSQKSECLPSGEPVMDSQGWFGIVWARQDMKVGTGEPIFQKK